ncbi:type II secretion system protein [Enterococcus ureilyticus]|uniref:competence type IV pilus minor pilin ComGE n=1 Tax=Enterococcus ureilyticus TaxID=1131292 RepID=UPI001A91449E|nr:competence type IV pilus minor pilin ComGE [Enterococcus ureilyticus]MBO0446499.1 type II secretion system protein [Enterococcus ureilyticus]
MLRKLNNYKAYILFESLIALSLLCMIVGSYLSLNTFLFKKNKQAIDRLQLHRVLYEEVNHYENYKVRSENDNYQVHFCEINNQLNEVVITDGKETVSVKKE